MGGHTNEATNDNATVIGGSTNHSTGVNSTIAGGATNVALNVNSGVFGGAANQANGYNSAVVGGATNFANGYNSLAAGGNANRANGADSVVFGGNDNKTDIDAAYSSIIGGLSNRTMGSHSTVSGGVSNIANSYGEWVGGIFGTESVLKDVTSKTARFDEDRIFNIGVGIDINNRKDGFTVLKSGVASLPNSTALLISDATNKAITTKEYTDANYIKFSLDVPETQASAGNIGEIRLTATYIYICVAPNYWHRMPVPTWP
jgi:hypothetical protein